jgi:hypothetical protein
MKIFSHTVTLHSSRTKDAVMDTLRTHLAANNTSYLEYAGTVQPGGTFTGRPNPKNGMKGRGTMPLFFGCVESSGEGSAVQVTFYLPPMVVVLLCISEVITLTVTLLMYLRVINPGVFPYYILPVFALLTPLLFYGTYRGEVGSAQKALEGIIR